MDILLPSWLCTKAKTTEIVDMINNEENRSSVSERIILFFEQRVKFLLHIQVKPNINHLP